MFFRFPLIIPKNLRAIFSAKIYVNMKILHLTYAAASFPDFDLTYFFVRLADLHTTLVFTCF